MHNLILAILLSALSLTGFDGSPATITVSGGIDVNGATQPFLFTWQSTLTVTGSGWSPGESVTAARNACRLEALRIHVRSSRELLGLGNHSI